MKQWAVHAFMMLCHYVDYLMKQWAVHVFMMLCHYVDCLMKQWNVHVFMMLCHLICRLFDETVSCTCIYGAVSLCRLHDS